MKRVRTMFSVILCIFLLTGCAELNEVSTSNGADAGYAETEDEAQTNNASNQDKKANKKKKKKNKKSKKSKNEDNEGKKEQRVTGEYSTDSDAVAEAKNSVSDNFYRLYNCYEDEEEVEVEVTYGEALNHYFDATVWHDVEYDNFEGVEFIGTKYEGNDTWEYHLYYSYNDGFLGSLMGGGWMSEYVINKNGEKILVPQNPHETMVLKAYCQYLEDNGYECEEVG